MPQFSPLWFINILSWSFAIIAFVLWLVHAIIFPNLLRLFVARSILLNE